MKLGTVDSYLYVLRITNTTGYTRKVLAWIEERNPELRKQMDAELTKLRTKHKDDLPAWLKA